MIEPLVNGESLTLSEARVKYREVEKAFAEVRGNYSLLDRLLRREMREEDVQTLKGCVGVLAPLSFIPAIQTEVDRTAHYHNTLHSRIEFLNSQISSYSARFKNAGEVSLARSVGAAI
ncbi:MAG: hypothetical protein Q7R87_00240 [Nanoarchaeota archaeon]|nr:hypothetical protein [Nanoarchaeota archaeon]